MLFRSIEGIDYPSKDVEFTGIAEVGEYSFKNQVGFTVITPDGSTIYYIFLAIAIGDV